MPRIGEARDRLPRAHPLLRCQPALAIYREIARKRAHPPARLLPLLALAACMAYTGCDAQPRSDAEPRQLVLPGVSRAGIFDPSVAETPAAQRAWMSYSAVDPSSRWPVTNSRTVSTRLAFSDDAGATWNDAATVVNAVTEAESGGARRSWNHEVSSLIFDPAAPAQARWKLFWHHYATAAEDRQFQHGWIAYKEAATPQALAQALEIKLLAGRGYDAVNDDTSAATGSPVAGPPRIAVAALGRAVADCVALSEPGALALRGDIYLALGCFEMQLLPPRVTSRILLLKCSAPCTPEPAAWRVVGTLLTRRDARALGAESFSAASLFSHDGVAYLSATPVYDRPFADFYGGCYIFRFADLAAGTLERSARVPLIVEKIHGHVGTFNGACSYAQGAAAAGFLYGELRLATPLVFAIYRTDAAALDRQQRKPPRSTR